MTSEASRSTEILTEDVIKADGRYDHPGSTLSTRNELREQTPELDKEYIEQIKGTLNEVKEGLFTYHANKEKKESKDESADELLEPLKKMAYSLGLTQEYVKAVKETLLWVLGPKCGPLLEVIESFFLKEVPWRPRKKFKRNLVNGSNAQSSLT